MSKSIYVNECAKKEIFRLQNELLVINNIHCSNCILSSSKDYSNCQDCIVRKYINEVENSISYWKELLDKNV